MTAASRLSRRGGLAGLGLLLACVGLVAGCGSEPAGDAEAGKASFIAACQACHTLEDAGTKADIGPNLDDAFRGARQQGFKESQFEALVLQWIEQPQPPMMADLVTGQDARDVAAYVASVAGTSPDSAIRKPAPFVTRPPVPGGAPAEEPPLVQQEGQDFAGAGTGEEAAEGEPQEPAAEEPEAG